MDQFLGSRSAEHLHGEGYTDRWLWLLHGNEVSKQSEFNIAEATLTNNGLHILFHPLLKCFLLESLASAKCEREGFIILSEEVINLARQQSSKIPGLFG